MSMHNTIDEDTEKVYRIACYTERPTIDMPNSWQWYFSFANSYTDRRYASLSGVKSVASRIKRREKECQNDMGHDFVPIDWKIEECDVQWSPWRPV